MSESYLGLVTPIGTVGFVLAMLVFGTASGRIDIKRFLAISVAATIVSVLISMGIEARPSVTGPVNVIANVAAQIGFFLAPATVGVLADATTIETAMLLQIGLAVALVVVVVSLRLGPLADQPASDGA
ncbi:MAG: hypothetical protein ABEJ47_00840 [Halorhabdus sp.]